jgi:N-acetylmuramoyl-L-alanine amidase
MEQLMNRKVNKIIIHCADTPEGANFTIEDIRKWHVEERGWSDIGYHFVIHLDGEILEGRPLDTIGSHTKGYNKDSIGICYIGGRDKEMIEVKDTRTPEQKASLEFLILYLKNIYKKLDVYGHRDFSNKDCPSFDAKEEYKDI